MTSHLQHLDLIASAPDGVKRLRELILELAVRGKLVPQDPSDEPASELFKRIQAEKAKLVAEGKIKKDKPLPEIGEDEKPFELPVGWEWVALVNIGYTQTGTTPNKSEVDSFGVDFPFIKPGDIYPDRVDYFNEGLSHSGISRSGRLAPSGTLLMVCIGTLGKCNLIDRECSFNQQINSISPIIVTPRYLLNALRSPFFQQEVWGRSSSTTISILNKGRWEAIPTPLPPIPEQHRIVAKVDELMALCDQLEAQQTNGSKAHATLVKALLDALTQSQSADDFITQWQRIAQHFDTLFSTEASVDALKQTILQLAVMGKLVPQDPNDEPASELLKRIQAEKAKLVAEGKIKKDKPLPEMGEDEGHFEVPDGWKWVRFGDVYTGGSGTTPLRSKHEYFEDGTEFWVKTTDLNNGLVTACQEKLSIAAVRDNNLSYYPAGTLCIAMYGGGGTIGKSGVLGMPSTINQSVYALPPVNGINVGYSHYYAKSVRGLWMSYAAGLRKDPNINGLIIKRMPMPLPPLPEQHRIVAKVDELMALCDQLADQLKSAREVSGRYASAATAAALNAA